jgi:hypothetical protein
MPRSRATGGNKMTDEIKPEIIDEDGLCGGQKCPYFTATDSGYFHCSINGQRALCNDTCLPAKDAEIERLKKQWECVPDEYENWSDFGQSILDDNDQLTDQCLERGEEIERLHHKLAERGNEIEHQRDELAQLRTDLAQERRLKDEARRELCETKTHNHPAGYTAEEYAKDRGWGYLYKKEQGK